MKIQNILHSSLGVDYKKSHFQITFGERFDRKNSKYVTVKALFDTIPGTACACAVEIIIFKYTMLESIMDSLIAVRVRK